MCERIFILSAISVWTGENNDNTQIYIYARREVNEFSTGVGGHADTRVKLFTAEDK